MDSKVKGEYDEKKLEQAMKEYLDSKYWKKYYEDAPSEYSKEWIKGIYYYSLFGEYKNMETHRKELKKYFGLEDWKYLQKHSRRCPFWGECQNNIDRLEAENK